MRQLLAATIKRAARVCLIVALFTPCVLRAQTPACPESNPGQCGQGRSYDQAYRYQCEKQCQAQFVACQRSHGFECGSIAGQCNINCSR
jgi:hypothetical protein